MAKKTFCDGCGEQLLYNNSEYCFRVFLMTDDWNIDKTGDTYDLCNNCVDGLVNKDDK